MSERVAFVVIVTVLAVGIALLLRRGAVLRRRPYAGPAQPSAVTLFAADECGGCTLVQRRMTALGIEFERVTYSENADRFRAAAVDGVPTLVVSGSAEDWQVRGIPTARQLRTWLGDGRPPEGD